MGSGLKIYSKVSGEIGAAARLGNLGFGFCVGGIERTVRVRLPQDYFRVWVRT